MARPSDLLRRFRLLAVPGAAGIAGVPVDREAVLREELAPVFAALRDADQDADEVISNARIEAEARRARAGLAAQEIFERTRDSVAAARASAGAAETALAESDAASLRAGALEEAARIVHAGAERSPALVDELVRRVLANEFSSRGAP